MASVNISIKVGNLAADPESRQTDGGKYLTKFRIGVSDSYNDETQWFNIVTFGKTAEVCARILRKGSLVFINGRDNKRSWKDDDGNWKNHHEIVAQSVQFLTPKGEHGRGGHDDGSGDDAPF